MPVEKNNGDQPHQAPDVLLHDPALMGRLAFREVSEKVAVVLLHVSVAVGPRRCHEGEVSLQVIVRGIPLVGIKRVHQESAELKIQRVFPGFEELVIVDASFAPVLRLVVQNIALLIEGAIGGAPQDAVRMRVLGGKVIDDPAIIPSKSRGIVIPVNRHGQRVTDEKPVESSPAAGFIRQRLRTLT